jgi:hypothetical protein
MTHLEIATQVMTKRKVRSQTTSLTPDHGKSGIDPIPLCANDVWHAVGMLSTRAQLRFRPHPDQRSTQEVIVP